MPRARDAIASTATRTPRIVTTRTPLFDEAGWRAKEADLRRMRSGLFLARNLDDPNHVEMAGRIRSWRSDFHSFRLGDRVVAPPKRLLICPSGDGPERRRCRHGATTTKTVFLSTAPSITLGSPRHRNGYCRQRLRCARHQRTRTCFQSMLWAVSRPALRPQHDPSRQPRLETTANTDRRMRLGQ